MGAAGSYTRVVTFHGVARPDERRLLERYAHLRERVVDVGAVSESEKRALYRDASVVLFPSFYEGFGLIPFEPAAFGTPCLYAWRGPVAEFLPAAGAPLPDGYSVESTASMILELTTNPHARETLVSQITSAAESLTWDETAPGYLEVYRRSVDRSPRPIDRAILRGATAATAAATAYANARSPHEVAVVTLYRRRSSFRIVVDGAMHIGVAAINGGRRGRPSPRRDRLGT
jgi:Glycosyl transferases group 1